MPYTILVAEDEAKLREFVRLYIKKEGYPVVEATNGLEAVQLFDPATIDRRGRRVTLKDTPLNLAPKEYDLLVYLVDHRKAALTRDQILEAIWGLDFEGGTRVIDNHVKKLRSKLGPAGAYIKTVISVGYKFEE